MSNTTNFATPERFRDLQAPTPPEEIGVKPGRKNNKTGEMGPDLSYITARFVQQRFDNALGPDLWQVRFERQQDRLVASIGVLTPDGWVWKSDVGTESDIEGEKGEYSDAFKRAAVMWGVGRDLYPGPRRVRGNGSGSGRVAASSGNSYSPAAGQNEPTGTQSVQDAEQNVVGQHGLTDKQRGLMFAAFRDANVTGDARKAVIFFVTGKRSSKQMTSEDLDKVLEFLRVPRAENREMWDNIEIVEGGSPA